MARESGQWHPARYGLPSPVTDAAPEGTDTQTRWSVWNNIKVRLTRRWAVVTGSGFVDSPKFAERAIAQRSKSADLDVYLSVAIRGSLKWRPRSPGEYWRAIINAQLPHLIEEGFILRLQKHGSLFAVPTG